MRPPGTEPRIKPSVPSPLSNLPVKLHKIFAATEDGRIEVPGRTTTTDQK